MWRVWVDRFRRWTPWTWPHLVGEKRGLVPEKVNSEQNSEAGADNSFWASSSVHLLPRGACGSREAAVPGENQPGQCGRLAQAPCALATWKDWLGWLFVWLPGSKPVRWGLLPRTRVGVMMEGNEQGSGALFFTQRPSQQCRPEQSLPLCGHQRPIREVANWRIHHG